MNLIDGAFEIALHLPHRLAYGRVDFDHGSEDASATSVRSRLRASRICSSISTPRVSDGLHLNERESMTSPLLPRFLERINLTRNRGQANSAQRRRETDARQPRCRTRSRARGRGWPTRWSQTRVSSLPVSRSRCEGASHVYRHRDLPSAEKFFRDTNPLERTLRSAIQTSPSLTYPPTTNSDAETYDPRSQPGVVFAAPWSSHFVDLKCSRKEV